MAYDRIVFRIHALKRMFQRGIGTPDVRHVLKHGDIIENYPDDKPYPSQLVLGWIELRPLHVVFANNHDDQESIIITAYEPDPIQWEEGFARRKTP